MKKIISLILSISFLIPTGKSIAVQQNQIPEYYKTYFTQDMIIAHEDGTETTVKQKIGERGEPIELQGYIKVVDSKNHYLIRYQFGDSSSKIPYYKMNGQCYTFRFVDSTTKKEYTLCGDNKFFTLYSMCNYGSAYQSEPIKLKIKGYLIKELVKGELKRLGDYTNFCNHDFIELNSIDYDKNSSFIKSLKNKVNIAYGKIYTEKDCDFIMINYSKKCYILKSNLVDVSKFVGKYARIDFISTYSVKFKKFDPINFMYIKSIKEVTKR